MLLKQARDDFGIAETNALKQVADLGEGDGCRRSERGAQEEEDN